MADQIAYLWRTREESRTKFIFDKISQNQCPTPFKRRKHLFEILKIH